MVLIERIKRPKITYKKVEIDRGVVKVLNRISTEIIFYRNGLPNSVYLILDLKLLPKKGFVYVISYEVPKDIPLSKDEIQREFGFIRIEPEVIQAIDEYVLLQQSLGATEEDRQRHYIGRYEPPDKP